VPAKQRLNMLKKSFAAITHNEIIASLQQKRSVPLLQQWLCSVSLQC